MARVQEDVVGQLEEPQALLQQERLATRIAVDVQVRAANVPDQERVAAEHQPGLLRAATTVGDDVGVVRGSVARCRDRGHHGVPELDDVAVGEGSMLKVDSRPGGQIAGGPGPLDERREPRDMVCLDVRLEDRRDRGADPAAAAM